jgi:hypothetical protein
MRRGLPTVDPRWDRGGATMGDSSILLMVAGVGRTADGGVRDLSGTGAGRPPRYTRVRR